MDIKLSQTTETRLSFCPVCRHALDHATGPTTPKVGDFSVCIECASILRFTDGMALRTATVDDFYGVDPDTRRNLTKLVLAIRELHQQ